MPARPPAPARPRLEPIEDRAVPAALALAGGVLTYTAAPGEANALTVSVSGASYRFNDAAPITAAPAGWAGAGTPTVSGPTAGVTRVVVDLGDGSDVLNLRATPADLSVTSAGSLAVNLSSDAPVNTGTVAGIQGNVTVTGGGTATLAVGNAGGAGATVTLTQTQIAGLLPGGKVIGYANVGSLRVATSDAADAVTINVTAGSTAVRVDTNGGDDTVNVQATRGPTALNTGAGNDTVTVGTAGAGLDDVTGGLAVDAGPGAANRLTLDDTAAAAGNAVTVTPTRVAGLAPAPVAYRATGGAFADITLRGSDAQADAFALAGSAAAHRFTVRGNGGADTFTVAASARADLHGGEGDDTFALPADAAALTGSVDGGGGENTLSYTGRAAAVGVTLTGTTPGTGGGTATGLTGGFSNVARLIGGGGGDTLTGPNAATAWYLTGSNAGLFAVGPVFSGFENLTGGAGDDTFSFAFGAANGSVTGSIRGGVGGSDRLNYAGAPGGVTVTLTGAGAGTGSRIGGTFGGIDGLTGNGPPSTLTGRNAAALWTIDDTAGPPTYSSGGQTLSFTGFRQLTGGTAADTFRVLSTAAGASYALDGGAGADAFTLSNLDAQLAALTLAGGPGADTLAVDDGANGNAAAWVLAAGTVARDGLTFDFAGFEGTVVNTGAGANAVAVEGTAAGQTLTVNAGGSSNDISVGQVSNRYDLAGGVTVNLTNAASVDSLTVNDSAADPGPAAWTLSESGVARSGAAAVQLTGAIELVVLTAGDGGAEGNAVDVTGSAVTAFVLGGGPGGADALTVHDGADDGLDDGASRVAFAGGLQPVDYFDFDLVPLIVD